MGFGEAGAEVIADNIKSGGALNPMVPGRKVAAIFGFHLDGAGEQSIDFGLS